MQAKSNNNNLFEGLEHGDLARLIVPVVTVDEFKSKMGDDSDIIVLSFTVNGKEPAKDLMNFIEKGYEWILDADVSSGELEDGRYLVFAELERTVDAPKQIYNLLVDITNLTDQDVSDWEFTYRKNSKKNEITVNNLANIIPLTPEAYSMKFGDSEIEAMQENARVPMSQRTAPINPWTESLRVAAGLK